MVDERVARVQAWLVEQGAEVGPITAGKVIEAAERREAPISVDLSVAGGPTIETTSGDVLTVADP